MEIFPAIDLRNGKCVRLFQGDYSQETVFSTDPVAMAFHWKSAGARRLHLVDLDGATAGKLGNSAIIEQIARQVHLPVQIGGGIRKLETIEQLLGYGVKRVILGTVAIEDPGMVKEACLKFNDSIIVSIDARDGLVRGHGWKKGSSLTTGTLIEQMKAVGIKRFIYTDISRDGTLTEPNFQEIEKIQAQAQAAIIGAGGISSIDHLMKLADLGIEGAIVGKAIYTGDIDLAKAVTEIDSYQKQ